MDPALGLSGGLAVGVLAGVLVGVLAGVLVDGVVAGLFLLGCLMSSNSSLGSWGIFVLNLSQEPFVHMYSPYPGILLGQQLQSWFLNLTSTAYCSPL